MGSLSSKLSSKILDETSIPQGSRSTEIPAEITTPKKDQVQHKPHNVYSSYRRARMTIFTNN